MVIDKAEVKIIYVCTEGRPWVKTANGYERVTYEEAILSNWPKERKPYDG